MDNIVVIGSSGQAKVVIDAVRREGRRNVVGLLDRFRKVGETTLGHAVLGQEEDLPGLIDRHAVRGVIVAIGDNFVRAQVAARIAALCPGITFFSVVHPDASIAAEVVIGEGSVVMAGAVINACASVGRFCILNTHASLDHDSMLGDFASMAPRAVTGGNCRIGAYSAIGIGATLAHGARIGEHVVVGAGAVVMKPLDDRVVAYGVPARVVRGRSPGDPYL
ncbi:MAG: NeuD/PglB/VioB family sugar acetyltransferase [Burkholderiales bacterium]|nr:NeuD/PglB/VioB family sugar acetyltransferase [Burkholderiales bacterium]